MLSLRMFLHAAGLTSVNSRRDMGTIGLLMSNLQSTSCSSFQHTIDFKPFSVFRGFLLKPSMPMVTSLANPGACPGSGLGRTQFSRLERLGWASSASMSLCVLDHWEAWVAWPQVPAIACGRIWPSLQIPVLLRSLSAIKERHTWFKVPCLLPAK